MAKTSHTVPDRILITGAAGFVGSKLADRLANDFPESLLLGADLVEPDWSGHPNRRSIALDITDAGAVRASIGEHRPDCIIHLAAQSHVPSSFDNPMLTWRVNVEGTMNLVEASGLESSDCLFVFVSSSEVYGREFNGGAPVTERSNFSPMNPYASSKAAADAFMRDTASADIHTIILRPFNHVGPGQRQDFVVSAFSSQIARIEKGLQPPVLSVGNLDARRDFLDVRDVLDAYIRVVKQGREHPSGTIWNLCTGRSITIQSILDDLLALSSQDIEVRTDPKLLRPSDVPVAMGDATTVRRALGWEPSTPWSTTLSDSLDYWRGLESP